MLILTRRDGETIVIETPSGEKIYVTAMRAGIGKVRLGIRANRDVVIDREEIYKRKLAEAANG